MYSKIQKQILNIQNEKRTMIILKLQQEKELKAVLANQEVLREEISKITIDEKVAGARVKDSVYQEVIAELDKNQQNENPFIQLKSLRGFLLK